MRTFYQFMITYRGKINPDEKNKLADWVFYDHNFPQHATDYNVISNYLEWNSPFPNALVVFDELWDIYTLSEE